MTGKIRAIGAWSQPLYPWKLDRSGAPVGAAVFGPTDNAVAPFSDINPAGDGTAAEPGIRLEGSPISPAATWAWPGLHGAGSYRFSSDVSSNTPRKFGDLSPLAAGHAALGAGSNASNLIGETGGPLMTSAFAPSSWSSNFPPEVDGNPGSMPYASNSMFAGTPQLREADAKNDQIGPVANWAWMQDQADASYGLGIHTVSTKDPLLDSLSLGLSKSAPATFGFQVMDTGGVYSVSGAGTFGSANQAFISTKTFNSAVVIPNGSENEIAFISESDS